ncbi:hemolysin family protein [Arsenicicoccus bolidensis]|uniref:Hemolysin family protein n=1 Tax=Arsenicicoccus bolidensis TaxID=229480 RepID=A0ABS9Q2K6_9MICO|nr:hemolysin family protein [Arsenicicoccus bolidensis]MCG7322112.1 hemolysin family protein [Arsenicicoccus bolidensis]
MSPVLSLVIGLVVVLLITAATGYFVAQEFAFMAVDRSRLGARHREGDEVAGKTLEITRRTSFMLSGAQLGITVTGLLVGYVAEPLIGSAIGTMLGDTGVPVAVSVTIGAVFALVFSTVVQMLFGELFPKNYAIARPDQVSTWLTRSTSLYLTVLGPVIWVFDKSAELLLRALHIEPVHDVQHAATARDLQHVVELSRESGDLPDELSIMVDRILDFPGEDVAHAMIPRAQVDSLRTETTVAEVRELMHTGHTRYPVIGDEDDVVGVVHLVDVLSHRGDDDAPCSEIMREPLVVPELMSLPDALRELDDRREQLACVVDEYGGFTGILTMEDLAEEIVGEITDEHDPEEPSYVPVPDDGIWVMEGDVHIDEVERSLGVDLPEGDFETIGGLVIDHVGGLPEDGTLIEVPLRQEHLHLDDDRRKVLTVEVLEVERYVPSRVRLTLTETDAVDADSPDRSGGDGDGPESPPDRESRHHSQQDAQGGATNVTEEGTR